MVSKRIPVISLFSGAGGLDLGFEQAGFQTLLAVDKSPAAVDTINRNNGGRVAVVGDLLSLTSRDLIAEIQARYPGVTPRGIIGGPPCQGFSNGNVLKDRRDPRNRLPLVYATLLGALNRAYELDFFVFENVTGLLTARHRDRLGKIRRAFRRADDFRVFEKEVNAAEFGLPQIRRRLFLVGLSETRWPTAEFLFPSGGLLPRTVADAIGGLPPPLYYRRGVRPEDVPLHQNHWTMQPKSSRFATAEFNRWRSFRRLSWDEPSPTVAYGNREIHIHPDGQRRLSVYEALLLQGFPDNYILQGNFSQQVTQVSNAVPPPVAQAIAQALREVLYNKKHGERRGANRPSASMAPSAASLGEGLIYV